MEKIASFKVNHLTLLRGVYVSRKDTTPSGDVITTFDIRMTEPNRQEPLERLSMLLSILPQLICAIILSGVTR